MADEQGQSQQKKPGIRTMRTDAQELMHDQKASFLDLFAKQQGQKQKGQSPITPPTSRTFKTRLIVKRVLVLVVTLGVLGGIGYGGYIAYQNNIESLIPRDPEPRRAWLTNYDQEIITVRPNDRTGILDGLEKQARSDELLYSPILVKDFNTESHYATPEEFFTFTQIEPPSQFFQSLTGRWDLYVAKEGMVFIFETGDRFQTWGSMLSWEATMARDFRQFVQEDDISKFRDIVIKNNDARVRQFFNPQRDFLGYSLILGRFLILSTSEEALRNTVERMLALPIAQ